MHHLTLPHLTLPYHTILQSAPPELLGAKAPLQICFRSLTLSARVWDSYSIGWSCYGHGSVQKKKKKKGGLRTVTMKGTDCTVREMWICVSVNRKLCFALARKVKYG